MNPFRYRGYVWDDETGLYYLRSRYYVPEWHRFINSDTMLGKVGALGSHNLFAYCGNNPVVMADPDGNMGSAAIAGAKIGGKIGGKFGPYGAAIGMIAGGILGCAAYMAMNPPTIHSQAKSDAISVSGLTQSLLNAKTVNAQTKSEEIFNYDYYFAVVVGGKDYEYLMAIDYAMDIKTAAFVVQSAVIMGAVLDRFDLSYNPGTTNVSYGIYTPTWISAERLASVAFGSSATETHSARGKNHPGEYYMHYHSQGHSYHIWFGQPAIFPYIE